MTAAEGGGSESSLPESAAVLADRRDEAVQLVLETFETMAESRGEDESVWGSMLKQAIKRKKPGFAESYYGFRGFNSLLEEMRDRGLIELQADEKSGGYVVRTKG